MSEQENRRLSHRWFEEVWNQRREAAIDEMMAADAVVWGVAEGGRPLHGAAEFRQFYRPFRDAFEDLRVVVEDVLADGDRTAMRITFTGRHTGPALGVPPTGRRFTATAIIIARWRDGQIVEAWNEFDAAGLLAQLTDARPDAKLRA